MIKIGNFLFTKSSKKRCLIIVFAMIFIYVLENSPIIRLIDNFAFNYIIKPILWIGLSFIIWRFPNIRPKGKLKLRRFLYFWAFNFAVIYIIVSVFAGVIDALGRSPYSNSLKGIFINLIFVGSALVGREFARNYLVNSFVEEENYLVFILIAVFMTITNISFKNYINVKSNIDIVKFIAQTITPEFAQNLFVVYLVYLGGPLASIIYLGIIQGFHWLSPILPDLKWITTALIGILCPVFFTLSLQTIYFSQSKRIRKRDRDREKPVSWMITSIISIGIIWFSAGVFPIYPSVIATGSMEPKIKPGDIILVKKIVNMKEIYNLKIHDVIQFKRDNILICHRIIEIKNCKEQGVSFKTKGDNNSGADLELVKPEDIKGTIVYIVPKIGWLTLLIKGDNDVPLENIEF